MLQVTMIKPAVGIEVVSKMKRKQFRNTMELRRKKRDWGRCPGGSYDECINRSTPEIICKYMCKEDMVLH